MPAEERRGAASGRSGRPARADRRKMLRPWGRAASSATSPTPRGKGDGGGLCVRAGSGARPSPRRPASSLSKARKTRGQPRRAEATRSMPWVPRAAQAGKAPSGKEEPVEDALREDDPGRGGAEPAESEHGLWAGKGLEPGLHVRFQGPALQPADEAAGGVGDDDHAGEPLRASLHEQPRVTDALLGEAEGLQGLPQPAARRIAETEAGCGDGADAPRGHVPPRFWRTPETFRRRSAPPPSAGRGRVGGSAADAGRRVPGWTRSGPGRKPWAAVQPRDGLRAVTAPRTSARSPARRRLRRTRSSRTAHESAYTVNDPSASSWKGQTPWRTLPLPLRLHPGGLHRVTQRRAGPSARGCPRLP